MHVYSNYYLNTGDYGVAATENSGVIVEGNYFENVDDPYHLAEADSGPGRLVARNNCLINTGAGETGGSVTNPPYPYTITTACDIKAVVTAQAGVGKVGLPGGPTSPPRPLLPDHPPPTTPPQTGLIGWATQNGGTTGGAGGQTVTVSDGQALADALESAAPLVIRVQGSLTMPDKMNDVRSNKTVLGVGTATLDNGLNVSSATNVIIRNLTFRGWDDDAVNVQNSRNVWIDHNTFDGGYDGALDIKRESDFVTVSWNRVTNHTKSMLLGHDDGFTADIGHLRVTYHHNWFDGSRAAPRVRFGDPVHVFNNYYFGADYGVASTMGAGVLVEGNYFENVTRPTAVGYAESDPGDLVQRDNVFVNSGAPEAPGRRRDSVLLPTRRRQRREGERHRGCRRRTHHRLTDRAGGGHRTAARSCACAHPGRNCYPGTGGQSPEGRWRQDLPPPQHRVAMRPHGGVETMRTAGQGGTDAAKGSRVSTRNPPRVTRPPPDRCEAPAVAARRGRRGRRTGDRGGRRGPTDRAGVRSRGGPTGRRRVPGHGPGIRTCHRDHPHRHAEPDGSDPTPTPAAKPTTGVRSRRRRR
ncbi:right-handed parallel beta-helix repeat-containing protein [Micromonospora sp. M12]